MIDKNRQVLLSRKEQNWESEKAGAKSQTFGRDPNGKVHLPPSFSSMAVYMKSLMLFFIYHAFHFIKCHKSKAIQEPGYLAPPLHIVLMAAFQIIRLFGTETSGYRSAPQGDSPPDQMSK